MAFCFNLPTREGKSLTKWLAIFNCSFTWMHFSGVLVSALYHVTNLLNMKKNTKRNQQETLYSYIEGRPNAAERSGLMSAELESGFMERIVHT